MPGSRPQEHGRLCSLPADAWPLQPAGARPSGSQACDPGPPDFPEDVPGPKGLARSTPQHSGRSPCPDSCIRVSGQTHSQDENEQLGQYPSRPAPSPEGQRREPQGQRPVRGLHPPPPPPQHGQASSLVGVLQEGEEKRVDFPGRRGPSVFQGTCTHKADESWGRKRP